MTEPTTPAAHADIGVMPGKSTVAWFAGIPVAFQPGVPEIGAECGRRGRQRAMKLRDRPTEGGLRRVEDQRRRRAGREVGGDRRM